MEGIFFSSIWELIYINGHLTAMAGSMMVLLAGGLLVKYVILPMRDTLNTIQSTILPSIAADAKEASAVSNSVLSNQRKVMNESVIHSKTSERISSDVDFIKGSVGKVEMMLSILGINSNRSIK